MSTNRSTGFAKSSLAPNADRLVKNFANITPGPWVAPTFGFGKFTIFPLEQSITRALIH